MCFPVFPEYSSACGVNVKQVRKDVTSDFEADERRRMMCPSNPPTRQDSTNTPAFFLLLVFTSVSFCNIVSAWSCLLWLPVLLFCRSGKGLAWRFHALFSVSPLPLRTVGYRPRILSTSFLSFFFFFFYSSRITVTFSQCTLPCALPSCLNSLLHLLSL